MDRGCFVIRNEGDGCLTSKYISGDAGPFAEACVREGEDHNDSFCGKYKSVWLENGFKNGDSNLEITRQTGNPSLFDLRWHDKTRTIFEGVGMLYDELLVGMYWVANK